MQSTITIFTDGASSGNPGPGGWGAIISIDDKVVELGGGEKNTTNNRTELMAVYNALLFVVEQNKNNLPITLYTDSSYVSNGITSWINGWRNKQWKNKAGDTIANVDIWKNLDDILSDVNLKIINVSGHSGILGNERADQIATSFIKDQKRYLYNGEKKDYSINLDDVSVDQDLKNTKDRKKTKAYSYVSLIGKDFKIHQTWDECKKRVQGIPGAKYRKTVSQQDEEKIKKSWGI